MPKPGPRSSKQSIIARRRGSLGDTSDESASSDYDDSTVDRTPIPTLSGKDNRTPQTRRRHTSQIHASDSQFRSPEADNNATDYGLEFTTSNIQNPSPRRCSTLRTGSSQEEQSASVERTKSGVKPQQQTANKKSNASKDVKKQNTKNVEGQQNRGDVSSDSEEEEEDSSDRENMENVPKTRASRSMVKKPQTSRKAAKQTIARKDSQKKNASKAAQRQESTATSESSTEEEESESRDVGHSRKTLREVNTPTTATTQKAQSHTKKPTKTKQQQSPSKHKDQTATTSSNTQAQTKQQVSMSSRAVPRSTARVQPAVQTTQAVAVKKPRKQKNPLQRERMFWREVNALQNRSHHLIPRLPFSRLVREFMIQASPTVNQITPTALEALQTASEMYVSQRLQDAYMLTLHRGRVTLEAKDMELMGFLKLSL